MALSAVDRMDFETTPEQRELVDRVAAFAGATVPSLPKDGTGFAAEACAALGAAGFLREQKMLDAVLVTVELSRASAALGATFASAWLFVDALRGAAHALVGAAESGALTGAVILPVKRGNDVLPLLVTEKADGVVLTGTTGTAALVPVASHALVVTADPGLVACVDLSAKGAKKSPATSALGLERVPRGAAELERVAVPQSAVLARGLAALKLARAVGQARSILTAAVAVGLSGGAVHRAVLHVRGGGKPAQSTEFALSDLATGYDAAFLAAANAAWQKDTGEDVTAESAAAKLLATRTATEICHGALGVCGEGGYADDLRQAYVDARHLELYDGSEAEQIDVIASQMLGES